MKKGLLLLLLVFVALEALADDMVLQIWQTDGKVTNISLNEQPRTTYSDGNLVIVTTKNTVTLPLEKVRKYTYASSASGINSTVSTTAKFSADGEILTLNGIKPNTEITIYSASGQTIKKINSGNNTQTTISIANFTTGVYLVKVNGVTYKMTKL